MLDSQLEFYIVKKDRKLTAAMNLFLFSNFTDILEKTGLKMAQYQRKEQILKSGEEGYFWTICKGYSKAK